MEKFTHLKYMYFPESRCLDRLSETRNANDGGLDRDVAAAVTARTVQKPPRYVVYLYKVCQ